MKKTYKIEVDCAACADKMEQAARKTQGVAAATVSFMTQKMKVEFAEGADVDAVMQQVLKDAVTWSTNYIVIQSLALGCLLAFALFHKRIHAFRDSVNDAATNSLIALMNTAVVTGFGGVVQGSHGFELVKEFALSLDMNPLISACVATAIVAAACGSCSGAGAAR
mgnify:FL=1